MTPYDFLTASIKNNKNVMLVLRNNKRIIGKVVNYDKHLNLLLDNVIEIKFNAEKFSDSIKIKSQFMSKVFLRGDNIVLILII
mmetsp:Transcript_17470/g.39560  ORF Transcript_17470/g.39560 Transcript_17470/m.39560 type:complete len:83 (-) Transcript_17470:8-256(-)